MFEINEQFCETPRDSSEIENQMKLFEEAIMEGQTAIRNENFDLNRKAKMEKALKRLLDEYIEFKNIKWNLLEENKQK